MAPEPIIVAAARPYPGEAVSGDAWRVDRPSGCLRIAVIDGLGHGVEAAVAANAALAALAANPDHGPAETLHACHRALHGTRGAAVAVTLIDPTAKRLTFAGVGNVDARVHQAGSEKRLSCARGIVGAVLPTIRPEELALADDWLLLVHTDGVSDRFSLDELLPCKNEIDFQALADAILARWARVTDDASVVIAATRHGPASVQSTPDSLAAPLALNGNSSG